LPFKPEDEDKANHNGAVFRKPLRKVVTLGRYLQGSLVPFT
jgi:hypothetical protein